jgi:hypothetical protein
VPSERYTNEDSIDATDSKRKGFPLDAFIARRRLNSPVVAVGTNWGFEPAFPILQSHNLAHDRMRKNQETNVDLRTHNNQNHIELLVVAAHSEDIN